jgi:hypothetical protein
MIKFKTYSIDGLNDVTEVADVPNTGFIRLHSSEECGSEATITTCDTEAELLALLATHLPKSIYSNGKQVRITLQIAKE